MIADAVINHMTGQDAAGTGFAGTPYEHYEYPGLFGADDFHHCGLTRERRHRGLQVARAGADVRARQSRRPRHRRASRCARRSSAYLEDLLSLGVAGFRIDAAKHMAASDVAGDRRRAPGRHADHQRGDPRRRRADPARGVHRIRRGLRVHVCARPHPAGAERHAQRSRVRRSAAAARARRDTRSSSSTTTTPSAARRTSPTATATSTSWRTRSCSRTTTARPSLYSGYAFSDRDAGRADRRRRTGRSPRRAGERHPIWQSLADGDRTCVHASTAIAGMLEWRRVAGAAPRQPGADEGDAYGFEREGRAVDRREPGVESQQIAVPTSLPSGSYCDVVLAGPRIGAAIRVPRRARRSPSPTASRRSRLGAGQTAAIHLFSRT